MLSELDLDLTQCCCPYVNACMNFSNSFLFHSHQQLSRFLVLTGIRTSKAYDDPFQLL